MNKTVFSILKLHNEEHEKVDHELISEFDSTKSLKTYANDTQNQNLKNMISLVERHDTKLFDFNTKIKESLIEEQNSADIVFSTTHKSKGKEYAQVIMTSEDFVTLESVQKSMEADDFQAMKVQEELNIFYVAATRVKDVMMLAPFEKKESVSDKSFFRKKQMYDFEKEAQQRSREKYVVKKEKPAYKKRADKKNEKSMINQWKKENGY
jgi:superfamily I DNA/RNA helicase